MKVVVYKEYGNPDVLHIEEIEKPVPKDKEILVNVYASSVNYGDLVARNFKNVSSSKFNMPMLFWFLAKFDFGLSKPKRGILGSEFSGVVESVGKGVTRFKTGDKIFGYLGQKMGAYTEYLCISENECVTTKPENISFAESAVIPYGAIMALGLLKKLNIHSGHKVLVIGASGSIGSAAVQIAKNFGARVTGVCGTNKMEFVKALGADKVIDYKKEDYTKYGVNYDLIFDVLGKSSISKCKRILKPGGVHFFVSFKSRVILQMILTSLFGNKKVRCSIAAGGLDDLISVKKLIEEGKLKSIIEKSFPIEQIADAHRYVEGGYNKANVAITMKLNDDI